MIATLAGSLSARAQAITEIEMRGTPRGERIWFDPLGLAVVPGTTIRFTNRDPGNSHTATAYHPAIYGRKRRIPLAARPWDSDFLLPDERFEVTLTAPGVYDYYCLPHEMAAMVGRIVVGTPAGAGWEGRSKDTSDVSDQVLAILPPAERIIAAGTVSWEGRS
ncbi:plastocyanin/azurin family copper-binding protein [Ruegeria sp. 2012CJ41-6]|uniref:Plastocyanin/azurin family copper-binding protein n=1 Tax=Ruegeria spongiae TaxID=2942209 RepID=A0ABT0Q2W9_9RHOB|nr:plastocyanin/azurin family copper-binding protein [Ruegeria spongiae]MCL6284216.1 plastocyanin/azurin family copper-binding protein [Ruegeria spongiae]